MTIPLHVATLLEMAASKNGFDRELAPAGEWLGFASTKAPLKVWLTVRQDVDYVAALSQHAVVNALAVVKGLTEGHRGYLGWHREKVFEKGNP